MTAFFYLIFLACLAPVLLFGQLVHWILSVTIDLFKGSLLPRLREFLGASFSRLRYLFPRQRNSR
jgi:hypothetical protein